jgi:hypothetical protein
MLEKVLNVGDPWAYNLPGDQPGAGGECSLGVQTLQVAGRAGASPLSFLYLPFALNGINSVVPQGRDVLSGKFSGCIMASYNTGGQSRVCHVSTGAGQDCKDAWRQIMTGATNVFQFKPADHIETGGMAWFGTYGLITSELAFYAITVGRDAGGLRITGIAKGRGLSPTDI